MSTSSRIYFPSGVVVLCQGVTDGCHIEERSNEMSLTQSGTEILRLRYASAQNDHPSDSCGLSSSSEGADKGTFGEKRRIEEDAMTIIAAMWESDESILIEADSCITEIPDCRKGLALDRLDRTEYLHAHMPIFDGPDQDKPWVKELYRYLHWHGILSFAILWEFLTLTKARQTCVRGE